MHCGGISSQRERLGSARLDNFASGLELIGQKLQMGTLQSRLDAEFLLAHMCSVKFKEWIVVLATLLSRAEVLFDLFRHDARFWKAYNKTLQEVHAAVETTLLVVVYSSREKEKVFKRNCMMLKRKMNVHMKILRLMKIDYLEVIPWRILDGMSSASSPPMARRPIQDIKFEHLVVGTSSGTVG